MMKTQITNIRGWVLGLVVVAGAGCQETIDNEAHCWIAEGDKTCMALFGGGFCSNDHPDCEGHGLPYGCVFERPRTDECYSPSGNKGSCAQPNPPPECTELAGESGESGGEADSSEMSETSECGDGVTEGDEECDDGNGIHDDDCKNDCGLPVCGDGVVSPGAGEACDDNNVSGGDTCTADCQLAGIEIWEFYYNLPGWGSDVGHEVEIDPSGNIDILVEHGNAHRVLQFQKTGALRWSELAGPNGWDAPQTNLAVGPDGQVVVGGVRDNKGYVRQLESNGVIAWSYEMPNTDSGVLAADVSAFGKVVVAGHHDDTYATLFEYYSNGGLPWNNFLLPGRFGPIAIGADGQVRVWHNTGNLRLSDLTGMIPAPDDDMEGEEMDAQAMALDPDGNCFVITQTGGASYTLHKFDPLAAHLWSELQDDFMVEEGADGIAALPNGGVLVAGYVEVFGQRRGKLTWFLPDGEVILSIVIEEDAADLTGRLYDVAVSPDGYAVAVGSRQEGSGPIELWVRKFAI